MAQFENESDRIPNDNTKYKDGVNRNARLIVRNISFKATEDALRKHFSSYGTVEEVKLLRKPDGKLVGCGFVHFTHVPMATEAIAATNKKTFLGRPLSVSWAVSKNKYEETILNKKVKTKETSVSSEDESKDFIKVEGDRKPKQEKSREKINRNARLVVRNVSFKATEESLKEHFEPYGTIHEVKLLKKPDGKLVGCAFVHFKNVPMAKKALLNTNMKPFLGRPISVDWAVAKDKYMQHIVSQELEMQEDVKKEDSDSDDDGPPLNVSNEDVKQEIKSEADSGSENSSAGSDSEDDSSEGEAEESEDDEDEKDNGEDDEDENEDDLDFNDNESQTSTQTDGERKRIKLNDAEDGCTVFVTNIPFSVDNDQLKEFAESTGAVQYALVCVDRLTEHSKGTGFVKFVNQEDASRFLSLPAGQLRLEGQILVLKPALKRENLQKGNTKAPKDNRNLYLVKEGVIVAGTRAAAGLSQADMAKRLALERSKTQMLKNLNRFVSRYRLVVSNLTPNIDDAQLRKICSATVGRKSSITECRVMRDLRAPVERNGRHPSKGYGFVMFLKHEDALECLRKLNNNPDIFDKNNRPIVSFSIEDRTALNARKKRLEKSKLNNPLAQKETENNEDGKKKRNRKRKMKAQPDESYMKKRKFEKDAKKQDGSEYGGGNAGKFVRKPIEESEFTGLTAKEGSQHKMRTNHKLKMQADLHKQNVKLEKKKGKRSWKLIKAARERVKQPKQKINKNTNKSDGKKKRRPRVRSIF